MITAQRPDAKWRQTSPGGDQSSGGDVIVLSLSRPPRQPIGWRRPGCARPRPVAGGGPRARGQRRAPTTLSTTAGARMSLLSGTGRGCSCRCSKCQVRSHTGPQALRADLRALIDPLEDQVQIYRRPARRSRSATSSEPAPSRSAATTGSFDDPSSREERAPPHPYSVTPVTPLNKVVLAKSVSAAQQPCCQRSAEPERSP